MKRSKTKFALGCLFIPVGLIAMVIGLGTDVLFNEFLFAVGIVLTAAGLMEIEIAALWAHLEEGE